MTSGYAFLLRLCTSAGPALTERVLVAVAHPDDDVIGMGSRLPRLPDAHVIFVTDGAPGDGMDAERLGLPSRAAYAQTREREARSALALAGVGEDRIRWLGIVDKEVIWHLREVCERLGAAIRELRPQFVVTHAFEGGHPDHDGTAFAMHQAAHDMARAGAETPPIIEFPAYRAGAGGAVLRQSFWPDEGGAVVATLAAEERQLKRRMLDCHASQAAILKGFGIEREPFRVAGPPDWSHFPGTGSPLYAGYGWGLDAQAWRLALSAFHAGNAIAAPS